MFLRAPSLDSVCVSDVDERTVSVGRGGGGGGGGGGGSEMRGFVFSRRVGVLKLGLKLAVKSASEGWKRRTQLLDLAPRSVDC